MNCWCGVGRFLLFCVWKRCCMWKFFVVLVFLFVLWRRNLRLFCGFVWSVWKEKLFRGLVLGLENCYKYK